MPEFEAALEALKMHLEQGAKPQQSNWAAKGPRADYAGDTHNSLSVSKDQYNPEPIMLRPGIPDDQGLISGMRDYLTQQYPNRAAKGSYDPRPKFTSAEDMIEQSAASSRAVFGTDVPPWGVGSIGSFGKGGLGSLFGRSPAKELTERLGHDFTSLPAPQQERLLAYYKSDKAAGSLDALGDERYTAALKETIRSFKSGDRAAAQHTMQNSGLPAGSLAHIESKDLLPAVYSGAHEGYSITDLASAMSKDPRTIARVVLETPERHVGHAFDKAYKDQMMQWGGNQPAYLQPFTRPISFFAGMHSPGIPMSKATVSRMQQEARAILDNPEAYAPAPRMQPPAQAPQGLSAYSTPEAAPAAPSQPISYLPPSPVPWEKTALGRMEAERGMQPPGAQSSPAAPPPVPSGLSGMIPEATPQMTAPPARGLGSLAEPQPQAPAAKAAPKPRTKKAADPLASFTETERPIVQMIIDQHEKANGNPYAKFDFRQSMSLNKALSQALGQSVILASGKR